MPYIKYGTFLIRMHTLYLLKINSLINIFIATHDILAYKDNLDL